MEERKKPSKKNLRQVKKYVYEISKSYRADMRVPARVIASEELLEQIKEERSLEQLINTATLPGVEKYALAMPDIHEGYGAPIGGVVALRFKDGVISPGAIGYDINCGVRLLVSQTKLEQIKDKIPHLIEQIFEKAPSGVGSRGPIKLSTSQMQEVLRTGAEWTVKKGYAKERDLKHCEANGRLSQAAPDKVSEKAKKRGQDQIGTLGSGNHFIELQFVEKIFNPAVAEKLNIFENQIVFLIHTGSRGLGHQVCTDYVGVMRSVMQKYKIKLPDPELAAAPINSPEGQDYFAAMSAAANYAWANRQVLSHYMREIWKELGQKDELELIYDVAHNIAKKENGLMVHRKGATRAFGPGHPEIPKDYQEIGQPVIIPGSMGTASYLLVGTKTAMEETFGSTCHGAGRTMSRGAARRKVWGEDLRKQLLKKGIIPKTKSMPGLAEEAPIAYKDINEVVRVVDAVGIARRVCRLVPLGVVKG